MFHLDCCAGSVKFLFRNTFVFADVKFIFNIVHCHHKNACVGAYANNVYTKNTLTWLKRQWQILCVIYSPLLSLVISFSFNISVIILTWHCCCFCIICLFVNVWQTHFKFLQHYPFLQHHRPVSHKSFIYIVYGAWQIWLYNILVLGSQKCTGYTHTYTSLSRKQEQGPTCYCQEFLNVELHAVWTIILTLMKRGSCEVNIYTDNLY